MKFLLLTIVVIVMSACGPSEDLIKLREEFQNLAPTLGQMSMLLTQQAIPKDTQTPWIITATKIPATDTPRATATITLTSTSVQNVTETAQAEQLENLTSEKTSGFYLVGIDISSGVWRSAGFGDSCYWEVTTKTGDIIDNHYGASGGTAYIAPSAFQVEFIDCGVWNYLGQ